MLPRCTRSLAVLELTYLSTHVLPFIPRAALLRIPAEFPAPQATKDAAAIKQPNIPDWRRPEGLTAECAHYYARKQFTS
jgi:hypothetical protein